MGPETPTDRLRGEVDARFPSWYAFQAALPAGLRGGSYRSVHNYLTGKRTPPREFLEAAGEVLGVRAAWLADGTGEKTRIADAAVEALKARRQYFAASTRTMLRKAVLYELAAYEDVVQEQVLRLCRVWSVRDPHVLDVSPLLDGDALEETLRNLTGLEPAAFEELLAESSGELTDVLRLHGQVQEILRLLNAPLEMWGVSPADIDFTRYAMQTLLALEAAMPKA